MNTHEAVVLYKKKKTFGYVERDITKYEKFTDIELNTTEAKVT